MYEFYKKHTETTTLIQPGFLGLRRTGDLPVSCKEDWPTCWSPVKETGGKKKGELHLHK